MKWGEVVDAIPENIKINAGRKDDFWSEYAGRTYVSVTSKESAQELLPMTGQALLHQSEYTLAVWADKEISDTFMGLMIRKDWKHSDDDLYLAFHRGQYDPMGEADVFKEAWVSRAAWGDGGPDRLDGEIRGADRPDGGRFAIRPRGHPERLAARGTP